MGQTIGYCRISTPRQDIERQRRNIKERYPDAKIVEEVYTGSTDKRPVFQRIMKMLQPGDILVCDSVSRFSRSAEQGWQDYKTLYDRGVVMHFLKEPMIDSEVFRDALKTQVKLTGSDVDLILEGVNKYLMVVAEKQVLKAFEQAQKELDDLHQRTSEGVLTAKLNGKQIGRKAGTICPSAKSIEAKKKILKDCKTFGGTYTDSDLIKVLGVSRKSYYKWKRELKLETAQ